MHTEKKVYYRNVETYCLKHKIVWLLKLEKMDTPLFFILRRSPQFWFKLIQSFKTVMVRFLNDVFLIDFNPEKMKQMESFYSIHIFNIFWEKVLLGEKKCNSKCTFQCHGQETTCFPFKTIDSDKRYGKMEEKFKGTQGWRNKSNQIFQKKYVKE